MVVLVRHLSKRKKSGRYNSFLLRASFWILLSIKADDSQQYTPRSLGIMPGLLIAQCVMLHPQNTCMSFHRWVHVIIIIFIIIIIIIPYGLQWDKGPQQCPSSTQSFPSQLPEPLPHMKPIWLTGSSINCPPLGDFWTPPFPFCLHASTYRDVDNSRKSGK